MGGRSSGCDVHVTAKLSYSVIAVRTLVLIEEMHDGLTFQKQINYVNYREPHTCHPFVAV